MKNQSFYFACCVLVALLSQASAAENNNGSTADVGITAGAQASAASSAKGVRAYAIVKPGGEALLKKGFKSITNPQTGVYCLKPKNDLNLDLLGIAPSVTVEWGESSGNNLSAFYHQTVPLACSEKEIEILTFSFTAGGNNEPSNNVAFVISVP
ncbi:hypothetical protein IHQ68_00135 [Chelatococcus sambhunathii]|uniref:Uncharacterized protein n=1 Tax=Chelatococcus sambhunathii TaxID=363953 RepID=A0ABU1DA95_9HYPH|nr:hypothetical protein [Chelatococcus sambhunathii]MDR4305036.1 hypothetical protein [Chelatococcus sambhunathii]